MTKPRDWEEIEKLAEKYKIKERFVTGTLISSDFVLFMSDLQSIFTAKDAQLAEAVGEIEEWVKENSWKPGDKGCPRVVSQRNLKSKLSELKEGKYLTESKGDE